MKNTVFGMTEAQMAQLGVTWGVGIFIALMLFIIWKTARESKAGASAPSSSSSCWPSGSSGSL